jgi:hypothetical protein
MLPYSVEGNVIQMVYSNTQEEEIMDNDLLLSKYIDTMNNKVEKIEERMDVRLNRIEDMMSKQNEHFDKKFDALGAKVDSTKTWVIGIVLTVFLGIGAMVMAVLLAIFKFVSKS